MDYRLALSEIARDQLRELPKDRRRQIGERLTLLQNNLAGDVKKLNAVENKFVFASANFACFSGWKAT